MRLDKKKNSFPNTRRFIVILAGVSVMAAAALVFANPILCAIGRFPICDEPPVPSDAVVVLYTGVEYYPRLIEAARLFQEGLAGAVVINGNRKSDMLRRLEEKGFVSCCSWSEDAIRILGIYGVPREKIIAVNAEDAFDTISEAEAVGREILRRGMKSVLVTTSKSHTRRAQHIWNHLHGERLSIHVVPAATDPYDPESWWKDGRQIRWVLAEYGAWVYYWWKAWLVDSNCTG